MQELEARLEKLEGALENQNQFMQQLASHFTGQAASGASQPTPHIPQTDPALYAQNSHPYPALSTVHDRQQASQPSAHSITNQRQSDFVRNGTQTSIQIPSDESYAATNPPLESPSLNLPGHGVLEGAM